MYKMRNGQPVEAAVEEIIVRGVGELRKNAFGDDSEDAKSLPWKREQAWSVLKQLAKKDEAGVILVLAKGDETDTGCLGHRYHIRIRC